MSDCRFGVSPVNYPDPDPDPLTIIMSPQSCKEESQYPRPTGLQMTAALWPLLAKYSAPDNF